MSLVFFQANPIVSLLLELLQYNICRFIDKNLVKHLIIQESYKIVARNNFPVRIMQDLPFSKPYCKNLVRYVVFLNQGYLG